MRINFHRKPPIPKEVKGYDDTANKLDEARRIISEAGLQMAKLFVQRMRAVELAYEHKKELGLPVLDRKQEDAAIARNSVIGTSIVSCRSSAIFMANLHSLAFSVDELRGRLGRSRLNGACELSRCGSLISLFITIIIKTSYLVRRNAIRIVPA